MPSAPHRPLLASVLLLLACGDGGTGPRVCEVQASLQPGEVLVTDAPVDEPGCGLILPAGSAGDRYRVALLRPDSASASSSPSVDLRVEALGAAAVPSSPFPAADAPAGAPLSAGVRAPLRTALASMPGETGATGRFHEMLRAGEREMVARIGVRGVLAGRGRSGPLAAAPAPERFLFDPRTSCTGARTERAAVLLGENDVMAIYQDEAELHGQRLAQEHVQRMLDFFRAHGKGVVETYFGGLPDVDGNGRVHVVVSDFAFDDALVVAYVWAGNYYERDSCPASDEGELIFFNPDRIRSMAQGEFIALGVLSHESEHLVSLYHRLRRTLARGSATFLSHPTWMEEGRAELADEVTSRVAWSTVGGPSRIARVEGRDLVERGFTGNPPRCCRPEAYGVALQAARTIWYLSSQPNGLSVAPSAGIEQTDIRNGGWHFHRWVGDTFANTAGSPGADAALFRQLTDSLTASGREGLETVLGRSWATLLEDFTASVMLHGSGVTAGAPGFATYDFVSLTDVRLSGPNLDPEGVYPWPVTRTGDAAPLSRPFENATFAGPIGPTGIRIHDFTSTGVGTGVRLTVGGVPGLKLVVTRLR